MIIKDRIDLPQSPDELFKLLTDMEAVAPCVPGAALDPIAEPGNSPAAHPRLGETRSGHLVMSFGPVRYRYEGTIVISDLQPDKRKVTYHGSAAESSGEGTFSVDLAMEVIDTTAGSSLEVSADVTVTGMIADYGKSMVDEVAQDVISQFGAAVRARPAAKNATGREATGAAATQVPPQPAPISGFRLLVRITLRRLGKLVRGHRNQPR